MKRAIITARTAKLIFANLSSVINVASDHAKLACNQRPKVENKSSNGADKENKKMAEIGKTHIIVRTMAKLLLKIID